VQITTIGLDIAKNVFQVHGIDAAEKVVVRKQLRRGQMLAFFKALPPCLVGMEACAITHRAKCDRIYGYRAQGSAYTEQAGLEQMEANQTPIAAAAVIEGGELGAQGALLAGQGAEEAATGSLLANASAIGFKIGAPNPLSSTSGSPGTGLSGSSWNMVARAWGFKPISEIVWLKRYPSGKARIGTGYRVRTMHEPILVCTVGNPGHKPFRRRSMASRASTAESG
jgi:hypothetical protein